jgi:preprotein translocase subunit SecG
LAAAFQIVQIIMAITIIILILLQVKGSGLGSIFGGDGGVYRTRRGVEKTMFQATVGLSIFFFVVSLVAVVMGS